MTIESLQLSFKGSRDYLSGSDIIEGAGRCLDRTFGLDRIRDVTFFFSRLARRSLRLVLDEEANASDAVGTVRFFVGGDLHRGSLVECEMPVAERRPYPEERIVAACAFDLSRRACGAHSIGEFTMIEQLVAMNKALHQRCFPDATGRWLFVKLESSAYPSRSGPQALAVQLVGHFGQRLTKAAIAADGRPIGHMFFSSLSQ